MGVDVVFIGGSVPLITKLIDTPPIQTHTSFCHWAAPTFSDMGQTALHAVLSVAAFAVALWSAGEQMRIYRMRYKLADAYARIAEEEWNRYNESYRPLENDMLQECMADEWMEPDYDGAERDYSAMVEAGYDLAARHMNDIAAKYALCMDPSLRAGMASGEARSRTDAVNYGYRDAEAFAQDMNDYRFNKRAQLLNLGRDLVSQSANFGRVADNVFKGAFGAAGQAVSGAMHFLGYIRNRNQTSFPDFSGGGDSGGTSAYPSGMPNLMSLISADTTTG
jgi:hypothetical protein